MKLDEHRRALVNVMSEKELQKLVQDLADMMGWRWYHPNLSMRDRAGFPDLTLVRPPEFFMVELKSEKGRIRPDQKKWIADLQASGVEVHIWRPSDWYTGDIEQRLTHSDRRGEHD